MSNGVLVGGVDFGTEGSYGTTSGEEAPPGERPVEGTAIGPPPASVSASLSASEDAGRVITRGRRGEGVGGEKRECKSKLQAKKWEKSLDPSCERK
ncbi:hypothetical protein HPP92_016561 [Vanilla planifolia]|uniref:Uncharacterized protein n=1 Tax=Vanilla planifolia TaxID=51239 RepID=A0A835UTG8_VANPL|nr:hypothetical protein HPP92_016561 [Vanilla planifolia]